MKSIYEMAVVAKCPKGGRDEYQLVVCADEMIEVEVIIASVERHTEKPIYQEVLCQKIAFDLDEREPGPGRVSPATGIVKLTGYHSGVRCDVEETFGVE